MEALRSPFTQGAQAAGGELLAAIPNASEVQNRAGSWGPARSSGMSYIMILRLGRTLETPRELYKPLVPAPARVSDLTSLCTAWPLGFFKPRQVIPKSR